MHLFLACLGLLFGLLIMGGVFSGPVTNAQRDDDMSLGFVVMGIGGIILIIFLLA